MAKYELSNAIIKICEDFMDEKRIELFEETANTWEEKVDDIVQDWGLHRMGGSIYADEIIPFSGEIVDALEDAFEADGIFIPNSEREGDPDAAIIYGDDCANIFEKIEYALYDYRMVN